MEMPAAVLLERVVSRLSGVPLTAIENRDLSADAKARIRAAVAALTPVAGRLAFLGPPFSLEHLARAADAFKANVLILDYLQRFTVETDAKDKREQLDSAVTVIRRFCDQGAAVFCASAVARQKSASGSSYLGLNIASFRGSSELEYGSDACYLLIAEGDGADVVFRCVKNRYGPPEDIRTTFDMAFQAFAEAVEMSPLDRFDAAIPAPARKRAKREI